MGIKNAQRSNLLSEAGESDRQMLDLYPGGQNEMWDAVVNLRMQFEGNYRHIKPRGGLELIDSFFGQVRSVKTFSAYVNGQTNDYIVIHTATGQAYLLTKSGNVDAEGTPDSIFPAATFNTTGQISIFHAGTVVYLFDFIGGVYKVYDLETQISYDWLSNQSTSISSWQWIENGDWTEDNIWGFQETKDVFVLQNFIEGPHLDTETNQLSYRSFSATIDAVAPDAISYADNAGVIRSTSADDSIGMVPASPDLEDYNNYRSSILANGPSVQGSFQVLTAPDGDTSVYLYVGGIRVPSSGVISVLTADTTGEVAQKISDALNESASVRAVWDITRDGSSVFLDRPATSNKNLGFGFSVVTVESNTLNINANDPIPDQIPRSNPDYTDPVTYRGYLVVDLLPDGSYALPGRPVSVLTSIVDIIGSRRASVELSLPAADANVEKRYLFATRWQTSGENAFSPSRPDYPNNAFFLAKEIEAGQTTIVDTTTDDKLITSLSAFIDMNGGIPQLFGRGQLEPTCGGVHDRTLFLGGYKINRPTPAVYSDPDNGPNGNVYKNFRAGTDLSNVPEVFVQFEYTDGKSSPLQSTGEVLTDAEITLTDGVTELNAFLTFDITQGPQPASGTPIVTAKVDSQPGQEISFEADAGATPNEVATELVNWINGGQVGATNYGPGIDNVTAQAVGSGVVNVEWDIPGTAGNYESMTIGHEGGILIDGNSVTTVKDFVNGRNAVESLTKSGNELQFHSLNGLVSKIYVVVQLVDDSYKLLKEIESKDPEFHGMPVYLPNSDEPITDAPVFTLPSDAPITTVDIADGIVAAVPFGQPRITEQFRIENSERIVSIIPTTFDVDKSQMRFRMTVFTNQSVQIGYAILDGTSVSFDFEVIGAGVAVTNLYGAWRVEGNVVYQAADGIYVYSQSGGGKIIDRTQYDVLDSDLQNVFYNRRHGEYWLCFGENDILVTSLDGKIRKIFNHSTEFGPARGGDYTGDVLIMAIGGGLYKADVDGISDDFNPIIGELISVPIGDPRMQSKIMEVAVGGQGLDAEVGLDLARERLERTTGSWSKDFTATVESLPKELFIHGTPFTFHRRGVMPRIRVKTTGDNDGFISHISLTHVVTENKGKSR